MCVCVCHVCCLIPPEPISLALPTPEDIESSRELDQLLHDYGLYEPIEESQKREEVLGKLGVLVKEWVYQVSLQKVCAMCVSRAKTFAEPPQ